MKCVMGGFNGTGPPGWPGNTLTIVEAIDVGTNCWQLLPGLSAATPGHGQVTTSDQGIWVKGGIHASDRAISSGPVVATTRSRSRGDVRR